MNARRIITWLLCITVMISCIALESIHAAQITGVVFEDTNRNLVMDKGEKGIAGVLVSNQRDVVVSDKRGRYSLEVNDETIIFITKPAGYDVPLDARNLPRFYYIHQPKGSPPLQYRGVAPTGDLPATLDFPMFKSRVEKDFSVIVLSDPQTRNLEEIGYFRDDVVQELVGSSAVFAIMLGDIMFDNPDYFDSLNDVMAQVGVPVYAVPGNHDLNFDSADDHYSLETFKRIYGPPYYSFDYGKVHFVVLDDIEWHGKTEERDGWYRGKLGDRQIEWLHNDLRHVGREKLVVLCMHIPFMTLNRNKATECVVDIDKVFDIVRDRRHLLALAGHTHTLEHHFLEEEHGWNGLEPLHIHVCATACGAWWGGPRDDRGIPTAIQQDGVPNGYHIYRFTGNTYSSVYKPAGLPSDFQIRVSAPSGTIAASDLAGMKIVVNVFDGSTRSQVFCSLNGEEPVMMEYFPMPDPFFEQVISTHKETFRSWVASRPSNHIWVAPIPETLSPGIHRIEVKSMDLSGKIHHGVSLFMVE